MSNEEIDASFIPRQEKSEQSPVGPRGTAWSLGSSWAEGRTENQSMGLRRESIAPLAPRQSGGSAQGREEGGQDDGGHDAEGGGAEQEGRGDAGAAPEGTLLVEERLEL